jgi:hypothetical protein
MLLSTMNHTVLKLFQLHAKNGFATIHQRNGISLTREVKINCITKVGGVGLG